MQAVDAWGDAVQGVVAADAWVLGHDHAAAVVAAAVGSIAPSTWPR
jgi:hypothetical protein